ncbi:glycosyltransferase [Bdellovibrio bacteriovorus]|uniref:glycosyltransferase n=1 Tax=Bdellovibrio bacteriovorus TaxID=959 RepID=UPI0035A62AFF
MNLVVAIPCLNESETIATVVRSIPRNIDRVSKVVVLVVDDGSKDNTAQLAREAGAEVVSHGVNKGLGIAFQSAVEWSLKNKMDLMVTTDGDGQFDANDIPRLIAPIVDGQADFVTASRFISDDYLPQGIPPVKLWGNRQMSKLISSLTGSSYYDVACGFRAYSKQCLLNLNLFGQFTYTQEVFLDLSYKRFRIQEVPSRVRYFEGRKSRMAHSIVKYALNTSKIIGRAYLSYYPLKLFWSMAAVLFAIGGSLFAVFIGHFMQTGKFTGYLWAGFSGGTLLGTALFLFILGLVVEMLDRIRVNQERSLALLKQKVFYGE